MTNGKTIYPISLTHFDWLLLTEDAVENNQTDKRNKTNIEAKTKPKSTAIFGFENTAKIIYNTAETINAGFFGKNIKPQNSLTVCNKKIPKSNKNDSTEKSVANSKTDINTKPDNERIKVSFILQIF